jgi:tryptophan synthase alpha chain
MSRIANVFTEGERRTDYTGDDGVALAAHVAGAEPAYRKAFIAFVTGGDPSLERSEEYILALIEGGADIIEIGIPFSDPIAEGPVIQEANLRALAAGTTVDGIFDLVRSLRRTTQVPIVLLTYLNPVHHYGYEAFFATCAEAGVDGIIIPDLPYDEKNEIAKPAVAHGIDIISLIAPTSAERITTIAASASGYIYLVSSLGVTGVRNEITTDLAAITRLIRSATSVPVAVGFGIHTSEQAHAIAREADGVIVGSAIVRMIAADPQGAPATLTAYARAMKSALN